MKRSRPCLSPPRCVWVCTFCGPGSRGGDGTARWELCLGLALLSKASAVLAVPAVLGALAVKLMLRRERAPQGLAGRHWRAASDLPAHWRLALPETVA